MSFGSPRSKKLNSSLALLLVVAVISTVSQKEVQARPLATFPTVEEGDTRVRFDFTSDIWNSPYQNKEMPQRIYELQLKVPFIKNENFKTSFTIDGEGRSVGRPDLVVGHDRILIGPDLRSQSVGFAFDYKDPDKSSMAFYISYDSASDEPYRNKRDISVATTALYTSKPYGHWRWILGMNQNENRGYQNGQAIPVIGLVYQPDASLRISFGYPFLRINWEFFQDNYMKLTAMPAGIRDEFIHYIWPDISLFAAATVSNRSYEHFNRTDEDLRLIFEEKSIEAGFRISVSTSTVFGLTAGYGFDRRIFEGKQVFMPIGPVERINPDSYAGVSLEHLF